MGKVDLFRAEYAESSASPGLMKQHYSPRARLLLFKGSNKDKVLESMIGKIEELTLSKKAGVLVPEEYRSRFKDSQIIFQSLGPSDNLDLIAQNLFSGMRLLDSQGVDCILTMAPPQHYIGQAIFDRLYKAAGSQIIVVD
jgi:L-threonylcarbamoyladenylate synthase